MRNSIVCLKICAQAALPRLVTLTLRESGGYREQVHTNYLLNVTTKAVKKCTENLFLFLIDKFFFFIKSTNLILNWTILSEGVYQGNIQCLYRRIMHITYNVLILPKSRQLPFQFNFYLFFY